MKKTREIQANLLPRALPDVAGFDINAAYRPAAHVGGDFYDAFRLDDGRFVIAVLDVQGHGMSAALITGVVKMSLHWRFSEMSDPARVLARVNDDVSACGPFVTACVGVWDPVNREWTYASAGHPGGLLLRGGEWSAFPSTGLPLGVRPLVDYECEVVSLASGDRLILYTDGVVEAGGAGDYLGADGLAAVLLGAAGRSISDQVAAGMAAVEQRSPKGLRDDATLIGCAVTP